MTEFKEIMTYSEWKKNFDELQKKFYEADKRKKGSGVL